MGRFYRVPFKSLLRVITCCKHVWFPGSKQACHFLSKYFVLHCTTFFLCSQSSMQTALYCVLQWFYGFAFVLDNLEWFIHTMYDKLDSETIHAYFLLLCKMKLHRNKNFSSIIMLTNCNLHTFLLSKHLGKCLHTRLFHSTCTSICDCDQ